MISPRPSNTTGEVGVARVKEHTRAGRPFVRYVATWPTAAGTRTKASFSADCTVRQEPSNWPSGRGGKAFTSFCTGLAKVTDEVGWRCSSGRSPAYSKGCTSTVLLRPEGSMATETTYTQARADELSSLMETAHLLRSPANARRLLSALRRALARKGRPQR